jgi:hypothetical protein
MALKRSFILFLAVFPLKSTSANMGCTKTLGRPSVTIVSHFRRHVRGIDQLRYSLCHQP